jgi:hypothetical protein
MKHVEIRHSHSNPCLSSIFQGDWDDCEEGDIRKNVLELSTDETYGGIEMTVNLVRVSRHTQEVRASAKSMSLNNPLSLSLQWKVTSINCMNECCALKHEHSDPKVQFLWQAVGGRFEFQARIVNAKEWGYAQFSSFIVM